jgi:hypothetical protein
MLDTYTKRFSYTTGNAFTLTGGDFTGYFNVLSGIPYVGLTQTTSLCGKSNFLADTFLGSYLFDRDLGEIPSLPNALNGVIFYPNEYITADNINSKLNKLNNNNIYLYTRSFIFDTDTPSKVTGTIALTSEDANLSYYSSFVNLSTFDFNSIFTSNPFSLDSVVDVETLVDADGDKFIIFTPTSTQLIAISGSILQGTCGIALSTRFITDKDNDILQYGNITSITSNGTNLFISDSVNNAIYKYSMEGYIVIDPGLTKKRLFIETIGTNESKYGVKKPKFLTSSETSFIVYNEGSKFFVEYDNSLNVKNTSKLISSRDKVLCIGYNRFYNLLAILHQRGNSKTISFFKDFQFVDSQSLVFELNSNELPLKILFSKNDSNVFYIVTTGFIYKKFLSKPDKTIGVFDDSRMEINNISGNFTGATIVQSSGNVDLMFIGKQDRVMIIEEENSTNTVLRSSDIPNYNITSINLVKDEYVQGDYINKEIFKIVSNLYKLKNQYLGRFIVEYTKPNNNLTYQQSLLGENLLYKGYTYLDSYDFLSVDNVNNFYIHENERVDVGVINRCLTQVYNLQLKMLEQTKAKNTTLVQYLTTDGTLIID